MTRTTVDDSPSRPSRPRNPSKIRAWSQSPAWNGDASGSGRSDSSGTSRASSTADGPSASASSSAGTCPTSERSASTIGANGSPLSPELDAPAGKDEGTGGRGRPAGRDGLAGRGWLAGRGTLPGRATIPDPRHQLRDQPALADAGLAVDQRHRRAAVRRRLDRRQQPGQLDRATDEDRARDAACHRAMVARPSASKDPDGRGVPNLNICRATDTPTARCAGPSPAPRLSSARRTTGGKEGQVDAMDPTTRMFVVQVRMAERHHEAELGRLAGRIHDRSDRLGSSRRSDSSTSTGKEKA